MGINITQTMGSFQFENKENLKHTAKDILSKKGASSEGIQKIIDKTIFDSDDRVYSNSQLAIIKASSQISINSSLKETLKYLKNHANNKTEKKYILGEICGLFTKESLEDSYNGELADLEFDPSINNIFAAA